MFYIAIVGRPNVGKSTLFNKIIGGRPAIVDNTPGVTRDRHIAITERLEQRFGVMDTGGFEPAAEDELLAQTCEQTMLAIEESDFIIFVVDGTVGINPLDEEVAKLLRKSNKPVILAVNKMENPRRHDEAFEFSKLGFEDVRPVSAEHSIGIESMLESALESAPKEKQAPEDTDETRPIRIAVTGKPNAGKSSLVNRLTGGERMMVSDIPGTTRDAIDTELAHDGRRFTLIDTAGIRRKSKVTQKLEKYSVIMAMKAIERADVALLLIDGTEGISVQEAKIAGLIADAGCGVVVVVNKWDIVEKDEKTTLLYEEAIRRQLKFMAYAPIVFVSALTGQRVDKIWDAVEEVFGQYSKRIGTAKINSLVSDFTNRKQPPLYRGRRVKFYYTTQTRACPPTFVIMSNLPEGVNFSYRRYMVNQIRLQAGFEKTPIRILFKKPADRRTDQKRSRTR